MVVSMVGVAIGAGVGEGGDDPVGLSAGAGVGEGGEGWRIESEN